MAHALMRNRQKLGLSAVLRVDAARPCDADLASLAG
jgi:hypothetical protein